MSRLLRDLNNFVTFSPPLNRGCSTIQYFSKTLYQQWIEFDGCFIEIGRNFSKASIFDLIQGLLKLTKVRKSLTTMEAELN